MEPAIAEHYETVEWYGERWEFRETLNFFGNKNLKILEIGCGKGYFLNLARSNGFEGWGIDINKRAIEFAKEKLKLINVYPYFIEEFAKEFPEEKFDLICFYHVIEHLKDPLRFLTLLKNALRDDGYIAFSFPNPNRIDIKLLSREKWDYPPHHLTRWNEKSIETLLQNIGFDLVKKDYEPLSLVKCIESIGTYIEGGLLKTNANSTQSAQDFKEVGKPSLKKKLFFMVRRLAKPFLKLILSPFGLLLFAIGKKRQLTGQAMLIIARLKH